MIERYQDPQIAWLFSDSEVYNRWAKVELAVLAHTHPSTEPGRQLLWSSRPIPQDVAGRERQTHHEMVAFLQAWQDSAEKAGVPDAERGAIHRGLTSSDVQDTALMLALGEANARVFRLTHTLMTDTYTMMDTIRDCTQIGRTHGQWATERPASWPWHIVAESLDRCVEEVSVNAAQLRVGKLSGPVGVGGTLSHLAQLKVLNALGLSLVASTQIIPRDLISRWANSLAELATVCEHTATQVRLLSQSEIAEVAEGHHPDTAVGSSAMPHKRHNPITAENICGLARMARGYAGMLQHGTVQWGDRDLSHSSVERVAIPDLLHVVCTILVRSDQLVKGLVWDSDRMGEQLESARRIGADSYLEVTKEPGPYLEAHERLRQD